MELLILYFVLIVSMLSVVVITKAKTKETTGIWGFQLGVCLTNLIYLLA